jgi:MFS family permease
LLLSLGASPFLIGFDSFATAASVWMLTLVGGMLADLGDRRRIIAICQSIQMLCPALIVILLLTGVVRPWMIITLSFVVGVTDALSMPSFQSIVPSIVERDQIASGLALSATQFNLSRTLGPAIAGILMASLGAVACFALNAASYLPFIWVALWILPRGKAALGTGTEGDRRHLFASVRKIARTPNLRGALLTVFLTSTLCGPLIVFSPVLVRDALHGNVGDFSIAVSAFGIGGLFGAITLLGVDPAYDRRRLSSGFAAGYGSVLILAALCPWIWVLAALLVMAGLSMSISNTSANTMLQATAAPSLRGQTVSLYMLAMRGGMSIGSLMTGLSVHLLGVRQALLINGILAVFAQLVVGREWLRSPNRRSRPCP